MPDKEKPSTPPIPDKHSDEKFTEPTPKTEPSKKDDDDWSDLIKSIPDKPQKEEE
jgi:hypothetical protein